MSNKGYHNVYVHALAAGRNVPANRYCPILCQCAN